MRRDPQLERLWRERIASQRRSGLTIRVFCRKHALNEHTFHAWKRTIALRDRQSATPAFIPVAVVDPPAATTSHSSPLVIRFPNGSRLLVRSGCDRGLLADVVALLANGASSC